MYCLWRQLECLGQGGIEEEKEVRGKSMQLSQAHLNRRDSHRNRH